MFFIIFHFIIFLAMPPFFIGVINRVKSLFAGRRGPPLLQPYFDIIKLLRKGSVYSKSASFIFKIAPMLILTSVICAGLLMPLTGDSPVGFSGDIILFVYLLALTRFLTILQAMDVGSSFEGMGASREAIFGSFSELTVFAGFVTLGIITRSTSLTDIFHWGHALKEPATLFLFATFFFILLAENSRMPLDDPNTHLELTMIHEVMILDNSGPGLGIILYASALKMFLFMALTALVLLPNGDLPGLMPAGFLLLKVLGISIMIGVIESIAARIRMIKIPQVLIASFVLTVFALLISLFERGMI
ncbi:MAG: NADH-quinone oxidoreductase subunit H [Deltaproteobacteria bacterium]|nr:NADH-quinone oxidoreductase subunit H [Deltaproteobacteria bacterium]